MSDIEAKFTFEENDPIKATFKAYDETPTIEITNTDYNPLENKPSINDVELVGNKSLDELGIQPKGDYALTSDIPDLTDYVKNTDYATDTVGGVVKISGNYFGLAFNSSKQLYINKALDTEITNKASHYNPIVPSNLDFAVKTGVTTNTIELTEDEKASAKQWLGYATPTEIMQAIASIPQFKLSIVDELPMTGEKMTLYFVPKDGADNDIYNEYVWIEQTSSYEFLGSTAVDLTDYVKNTDYAGDVGGVIKISSVNGLAKASNGYLLSAQKTLEDYNSGLNNMFVSKGTLENIKDDYVKRGLTENAIELTDNEKTSARTWIGAVGNTDYAQINKAGLITPTSYFGLNVDSQGSLHVTSFTVDQLKPKSEYTFIGKGTLENVLTQYAKTVSLTQAEYDALATKDANTLYLIEEE